MKKTRCPLSLLLFSFVVKVLTAAIEQVKRKDIQIGKEELKLFPQQST